MAKEIELKLAIPGNVKKEKILRHELINKYAKGEPCIEQLTNTYFDTPNFKLRQNKITLRIRQIGSRYIQTVKSAGINLAGLHVRQELEQEVSGLTIEPEAITDESLQKLIRKYLKQGLKPIFTTEIQRCRWDLVLPKGVEVECAFDTGKVRSNERVVRIKELELELKKGDVSDIYQFALKLVSKKLPLFIEGMSKGSKGYYMYMDNRLADYEYNWPPLNNTMTVENAFEEFAGHLLSCWHKCQAVETLKDSVGLRYEVALDLILEWAINLLNIFSEALPVTSTTSIKEDISKIYNKLQKSDNYDDYIRSIGYTKIYLNCGKWFAEKAWLTNQTDENQTLMKMNIFDYAIRVLNQQWQSLKSLPKLTDNSIDDYYDETVNLNFTILIFSSIFESRQIDKLNDYLHSLISLLQKYFNDTLYFDLEDDEEKQRLDEIKNAYQDLIKSNPYFATATI